jgi:hypothetical protein
MSDSMNELEQVIRHLEAMAATMTGLTKLLRQMAERPWPDYPNGEGVAIDDIYRVVPAIPLSKQPSAGSLPSVIPAGPTLACTCGHPLAEHHPDHHRCLDMDCGCWGFSPTMTDPRD